MFLLYHIRLCSLFHIILDFKYPNLVIKVLLITNYKRVMRSRIDKQIELLHFLQFLQDRCS